MLEIIILPLIEGICKIYVCVKEKIHQNIDK